MYLLLNISFLISLQILTLSEQQKGVLSYCMSKAALDQFTKTTALELASHQVRCNAVNPGIVKTEMMEKFGLKGEAMEKV